MLLRSPRDLHYPITIRELLKKDKDYVNIADPLFSYTYKATVSEIDTFGDETKVEKDFTTKYESAQDGDLVYWRVEPGTVITGSGTALCEIKEACTHDVVYGGMCAICGKEVPEIKLNDMHHLPHVRDSALIVSQNELHKTEDAAKKRLLSSKKLSLVVDLDQTVIHATVDPTVAEWQQDETNPNHQAVKDVAAFQLRDDNGQWVWYYIKQRPGLKRFFEQISKLYQLHIYTMGTRAYAENIAKIIDPHSNLFGDRILSRTDIPEDQKHKNLQDLFPVDTKMVVIIDDRADVWNYSDYLVKVVPYEFFVGIGDINAAFLARAPMNPAMREIKPPAVNGTEPPPEAVQVEQGDKDKIGGSESASQTGTGEDLLDSESPLSQIMSLNEGNDAAALESKTEEQNEILAAQVSERPLLQRQKIQDREDEADDVSSQGDETEEGDHFDSQRQRHSILRDDDIELNHLSTTLEEIHRRFFETYDQSVAGSMGGRVAELRGNRNVKKKQNEDFVPDVKDIIALMKRELSVLQNTVLVFSKIAPIQTDIKETLVGRLATTYGATIGSTVNTATTHLITIPDVGPDPRRGEPAKIFLPSTSKVNTAHRIPTTKVILDPYILDSSVSFKRLSEEPYQIRLVGGPEGEKGETIELNEASKEDDGLIFDEADDKPTVRQKGARPKMPLQLDVGLADDADDTPGFSPTEAESRAFWADNASMLLELSDEDLEDISDDSEDSEEDPSVSHGLTDSPKKRKRTRSGVSTGTASEAEDVVSGGLGSELQKRRKRALQRTSSLTNVSTADDGNDVKTKATRANVKGQETRATIEEEADDSDLAADEDRLAAELAELDDEDEDL